MYRSRITSAIHRLQPGRVEHLPRACNLLTTLPPRPGVLSLDHVVERWLARRTAA